MIQDLIHETLKLAAIIITGIAIWVIGLLLVFGGKQFDLWLCQQIFGG